MTDSQKEALGGLRDTAAWGLVVGGCICVWGGRMFCMVRLNNYCVRYHLNLLSNITSHLLSYF